MRSLLGRTCRGDGGTKELCTLEMRSINLQHLHLLCKSGKLKSHFSFPFRDLGLTPRSCQNFCSCSASTISPYLTYTIQLFLSCREDYRGVGIKVRRGLYLLPILFANLFISPFTLCMLLHQFFQPNGSIFFYAPRESIIQRRLAWFAYYPAWSRETLAFT